MATVAILNIGIRAQTRQFNAGIRSVIKAISNLKVLLAGIAAGVAATAFKRIIDSIDEVAKRSARLGITTEEFTRLQFAAEKAGIEQAAFAQGLQRFIRRVAEAARESGEFQNTLQRFGINAREFIRLPITEQLATFADSLQASELSANQLLDVFKGFDSEGAGFVVLLRNGGEALRQAAAEADRFGATISTLDARRAENVADRFTELQAVFRNLSRRIVLELAPAVSVLVTRFFNTGGEGLTAGEKIARGFEVVNKVLAVTGRVISSLRGLLEILQGGLIEFLALAAEIARPITLPDSDVNNFLDAFIDERETAAKLINDGLQRITDAVTIPLSEGGFLADIERFKRELEKSRGGLELLGDDAFDRGGVGRQAVPANAALERGTAEAFRAIGEIESQEQSQRLLRQQLDEEKNQVEILGDILDAVEDNGFRLGIAF